MTQNYETDVRIVPAYHQVTFPEATKKMIKNWKPDFLRV
jgi:hypothetical protein